MALAWCRDAGIYIKMFSDVIRDIRRIPEQEDRADAPLTLDQLLPCFFLFAGKHCTPSQKLLQVLWQKIILQVKAATNTLI